MLAYIVSSALGGDTPLQTLLGPFAERLPDSAEPYPMQAANDMRLAIKLQVMPQICLDWLDWERIKISPK